MALYGLAGRHDARSRHRWLNRFQIVLLVLTLVGIAAAAGSLLFGENGLWLALATCALTLLIEPVAASAMTLRLYGARPLRRDEAPAIWSLLRALAARAGLPNTPVPYYVPSGIVNAFATGSRRLASIALTDGLLRSLSIRELQAVLAHEVAHIAQEDLRVMGLADSISRLTNLLALLGQVALLISMPALLVGAVEINWIGLLLLVASPQLALDHGINANLLFKWRRQYRADLLDAPIKQVMLQVAVVGGENHVTSGAPAKLPPTAMTEVGLPAVQAHRAIEVQFADALVRIDTGADIALLRSVLSALRR